MKEQSKRSRYTLEFKQEALRLINAGQSVASIDEFNRSLQHRQIL